MHKSGRSFLYTGSVIRESPPTMNQESQSKPLLVNTRKVPENRPTATETMYMVLGGHEVCIHHQKAGNYWVDDPSCASGKGKVTLLFQIYADTNCLSDQALPILTTCLAHHLGEDWPLRLDRLMFNPNAAGWLNTSMRCSRLMVNDWSRDRAVSGDTALKS